MEDVEELQSRIDIIKRNERLMYYSNSWDPFVISILKLGIVPMFFPKYPILIVLLTIMETLKDCGTKLICSVPAAPVLFFFYSLALVWVIELIYYEFFCNKEEKI